MSAARCRRNSVPAPSARATSQSESCWGRVTPVTRLLMRHDAPLIRNRCSCSSGPRASRSLMIMSERDARGPEDDDKPSFILAGGKLEWRAGFPLHPFGHLGRQAGHSHWANFPSSRAKRCRGTFSMWAAANEQVPTAPRQARLGSGQRGFPDFGSRSARHFGNVGRIHGAVRRVMRTRRCRRDQTRNRTGS
jgi:hypothetical protein